MFSGYIQNWTLAISPPLTLRPWHIYQDKNFSSLAKCDHQTLIWWSGFRNGIRANAQRSNQPRWNWAFILILLIILSLPHLGLASQFNTTLRRCMERNERWDDLWAEPMHRIINMKCIKCIKTQTNAVFPQLNQRQTLYSFLYLCFSRKLFYLI